MTGNCVLADRLRRLYAKYSLISEMCKKSLSNTFISLNSISNYSDDEFWNRSETYLSEHKYYKYYPYKAYPDIETEDKDIYYTLMLSQPVVQGSSGIWCVERYYDSPKYGYVYAIFPENGDISAIDTFTELQASCEAGENTELYDPLYVALQFVREYFGHTAASIDSFEETDSIPSGEFRF